MPETGMRAMVGAKAARAGVPAHQRSPDKTTAKNDSTTAPTGNRRIFMFRSFSIRSSLAKPSLPPCWLDVIELGGSLEPHTLRRRNRRWQRPQERGSAVVDFPAQQHGIVLMQGVVAVLHEHPAEVPELHGDLDASVRAEAIDVLAPLLPRRHVARAAVALEDLPLLEVDMDRMIPAAAVVHQVPDLAGAESRRRRDPPEVRVELVSAVRTDAPGAAERSDWIVGRLVGAVSELERARPRHGNRGQIRVRDHDGGHLALIGLGRIPNDAEL